MRFARERAPQGEPGEDTSTAGGGTSRAGGKSKQESTDSAQPSPESRVSEDMATLAIHNPGVTSTLHPGRIGYEAGEPVRGYEDAQTDGTRRSDAEIMLAVAAGDEAGYNYLVQKYHRQIIHFLFRMVRNESVAEELAQEVFLRVYRSRESYRAEAKFSTWLYRIATNLAVNHARDTKHERIAEKLELDAPDEESGTTPEVADAEINVEQRMLRDERLAAIKAQVTALPERQRMAVLMHKYEEMDYRQIGEVLKLSESATKSLLFRAYQTLRERLKEFV
jgi:RNA polymerase sigma-70 factor (ECF subfamily)